MVKALRIAHVTATYPPYAAGTGNVCYHNTRELARRGHKVHVFTARTGNAPPREVQDGVRVHRLQPWLRYGNGPFLPQLFRRLQPFDLIHLHMPFYGGSEAVFLARRLRRTSLVVTYHQDVHLAGAPGLICRLHDRVLGTGLMRAADRVCFTSMDYGLSCQYGSLLAGHRLRASELSNGVDPRRFTPGLRPEKLAARWGLQGKQVLLFVGALDRAHYFKGIEVLLQAFTHLQRPDLALVVAGEGDMRAVYRRQAQRMGLEGTVHFTGFLPHRELPDIYRLADLTVLPSTTSGEAFGLVLVESLASGTPVVASSLPGVRTVVSPGVDGQLARPGDPWHLAQKIEALLALPVEKRRQMGCAGRRKVKRRYTWSRIGARLEAIYEQILKTAAVHDRPNRAKAST